MDFQLIKDKWQLQLHIRTLKKVGQQNLQFYTSVIPNNELSQLRNQSTGIL
jgi:hypothetical protein